MTTFYWIFPKIDGFQNPNLEFDGFGRTPRTRANAAPAVGVVGMVFTFKVNIG